MKTSQKNVPKVTRNKTRREILENKFINIKPETDRWGDIENDVKENHLFSVLLYLYYSGKIYNFRNMNDDHDSGKICLKAYKGLYII